MLNMVKYGTKESADGSSSLWIRVSDMLNKAIATKSISGTVSNRKFGWIHANGYASIQQLSDENPGLIDLGALTIRYHFTNVSVTKTKIGTDANGLPKQYLDISYEAVPDADYLRECEAREVGVE